MNTLCLFYLTHATFIYDAHIIIKTSVQYNKRSALFLTVGLFNHLKPAGHVMHHQFNIQQLYALPTLYLCVLYLSENKQRLVPLKVQTDSFL
jgi:hypothetical protein